MTDWAALEKPVKRRRIGKRVVGGPRESPIQRQIVKEFRKLGLIVHHSPNGAALGGNAMARMKQSAVLKADGMMPGWPDLALVNRDGALGVIEVKKPGGEVSKDQEDVGKLLAARGVPVAFVCSLDEALDALKQWGWI